MKIAIPSDNGTTINKHFGRSKIFWIYTFDGNKLVGKKRVENQFTGHALGLHLDVARDGHGKGQHSHKKILDAIGHCNMVVAGGMGQRMINDFSEKQIEVVLTKIDDVEAALAAFVAGTLISEGTACSHHH